MLSTVVTAADGTWWEELVGEGFDLGVDFVFVFTFDRCLQLFQRGFDLAATALGSRTREVERWTSPE